MIQTVLARHRRLAAEMARARDPDGLAILHTLAQKSGWGEGTRRGVIVRAAYILAAKGGSVGDITVGDCLELVEVSAAEYENYGRDGRGPYFYTPREHASRLLAESATTQVVVQLAV